jgi:hypothetical protein
VGKEASLLWLIRHRAPAVNEWQSRISRNLVIVLCVVVVLTRLFCIAFGNVPQPALYESGVLTS